MNKLIVLLSFVYTVKWCVVSVLTSAPVCTDGSTTKRPWCGKSVADSLSHRTMMRTDKLIMSCTNMPQWLESSIFSFENLFLQNMSLYYCFFTFTKCKMIKQHFVECSCMSDCWWCSNITRRRNGDCRQENYVRPR